MLSSRLRTAFLGLAAAGAWPSASAEAQAAGAAPADDEPPISVPQPAQSGSLIAMQFSPDPHAGRDRWEMIRSGELGLAALRLAPSSFAGTSGEYADVHGEFCAFDPAVNSGDPAAYPNFHAVAAAAPHCGEHRYTLPLREVMTAVDEHDSSRGGGLKRLPVSGLLFHEGHSGAGLVSNALATFDTARVVAEHPAVRDALSACDVVRNRYRSDDCSPEAQRKLVQDVVNLLSRAPSTSVLQHLYLKLPAESAAYLPEMRSLYPGAAWAFVYRQPAHALAKATARKRSAGCVKARSNPSSALAARSREYSVDLAALSRHEVCALHLSTLMEVAAVEHERTGTGMIISYDDLIAGNPGAITDRILPFLGLSSEVDADPQGVRERVEGILSKKSNVVGRPNKDDHWWEGEHVEITEEVGNAVRAFMGDSMDSVTRLL